ncbi:hypothetical protein DQ237_19110 [Blastococcus sp. TF02-8]|uniref:hypothetical protein n=1 Tax=Blastococcus sp. TF02-8 TaxID=2250574 RepID=UPI000DE8F775|nr:hypothetical protein [Blastococcus sp. TF02-8]RBY91927.1 hypothetical protein DQ237_19110 [Blastococcus sp. TF02-8]
MTRLAAAAGSSVCPSGDCSSAWDAYAILLELEEQLADADVVDQLHGLLTNLPAIGTGRSAP